MPPTRGAVALVENLRSTPTEAGSYGNVSFSAWALHSVNGHTGVRVRAQLSLMFLKVRQPTQNPGHALLCSERKGLGLCTGRPDPGLLRALTVRVTEPPPERLRFATCQFHLHGASDACWSLQGLALGPGPESGKLGPAGSYLLVPCLDSGDPSEQRSPCHLLQGVRPYCHLRR